MQVAVESYPSYPSPPSSPSLFAVLPVFLSFLVGFFFSSPNFISPPFFSFHSLPFPLLLFLNSILFFLPLFHPQFFPILVSYASILIRRPSHAHLPLVSEARSTSLKPTLRIRGIFPTQFLARSEVFLNSSSSIFDFLDLLSWTISVDPANVACYLSQAVATPGISDLHPDDLNFLDPEDTYPRSITSQHPPYTQLPFVLLIRYGYPNQLI